MTIQQLADGDAVEDWAHWPPPEPAGPAEHEERLEESLLEAAACGDVAYVDRMSGWWEFEDEEPLPGWEDADRVAADPAERLGREGWLAVRARGLNREHARFLAAVHQVGHAESDYDARGRPRRDGFAVDRVGAALGHSTAMAGSWLSLAEAVIERLPRVYEAMAAGWLDLAKARVLADDTREMPDDLAGTAVARVLPRAPRLSKPQLALALEVAAGELDPDWYRRREQAARSRVRVEWSRNRTGTGEVALRDLGAPATVAIKARVDALARELRHEARRADLGLGLPALRALVAQRLLEGSHVGLDDDALLVALVAELPAWAAELHGDSPEPPGSPDSEGSDTDGEGPAGEGPDGEGPNGEGGPNEGGPGDGGAKGSDGAGLAVLRAGTTELRVPLSAALGLDDRSGAVPGSGPLPACRARRALCELRTGDTPTEWRVVLVDDDGHLEYVLLARPDPPGSAGRTQESLRRRVHGLVIVELAAPTATVAALDPGEHPSWAHLIRRVQLQLTDLVRRGAQLGGPHHPATTRDDAHRRLPGAELARFVCVRDRSCIGVMCSGTAHDAEIDHTRDWGHFGLTVAPNLGPPCRRCHRLKHVGGWQLSQPEPGAFVWRSPLGATYTVAPRRVLEPALDPAPQADGRPRPVLGARRPPPVGDDGWVASRCQIPSAAGIPTPPAPRRVEEDDEPPF